MRDAGRDHLSPGNEWAGAKKMSLPCIHLFKKSLFETIIVIAHTG